MSAPRGLRRLQQARSTQTGAAILTAMLLMTLVATLSAAALWQQWRALDLETAERTRVQASWILQGTNDWARLILREDARSGPTDHLAEPWAVSLQETKLSTFLASSDELKEDVAADVLQSAFLSGGITDLQSRLNVTNLVQNQRVHAPSLRAFTRLFESLQLPTAELELLVDNLQLALEQPNKESVLPPSNGNTPGQQPGEAPARPKPSNPNNIHPLAPRTLEQLRWLGLSEHTIAQLQPYAVVLPVPTPVNLNTASAPVLQAVVADLDVGGAQRMIDTRAKEHFRQLADASAALGKEDRGLNDNQHSVSSRYFEVRSRLRLGALNTQERTVVQRQGLVVTTLWKERETPTIVSVQ